MFKHVVSYFVPAEHDGDHWHFRPDLAEQHVRTYLIRSGIPTFLFWSLDLAFMQSNPVLAAVCLGITLPFSYMFGLALRTYLDQRKSVHR